MFFSLNHNNKFGILIYLKSVTEVMIWQATRMFLHSTSDSLQFYSFLLKHHLNAPATPNSAMPIELRVHTEETHSSVTATTLPHHQRGTASPMLLAPECLLHQWRSITAEPMHLAGWMVIILLRMMELLSERSASTGAATFVNGA